MIPSSLHRKVVPNSVIKQSEWNALVDAVRASRSMQSGVLDESSAGDYDTSHDIASTYKFNAHCTEFVPRYSIFCLKAPNPAPAPDVSFLPFQIEIEKAHAYNQKLYLTNGESLGGGEQLEFGCKVEIITGFRPVLLTIYKGSGAVPLVVNRDCGPHPLTWEITAGRTGLICLAIDATGDQAWCVRTDTGKRWLCKPDVDIAVGTAGAVKVWGGQPGGEEELSPAQVFTVTNRTSAVLTAAKFCEMIDYEGKLYAVPWECP